MGDERLREIYDRMSVVYDTRRTKEYFDALIAYLKHIIPKKSKILEIGSGTGGYCIALSKYGCVCKGVDYSEKMVDMAKYNNSVAKTNCIFKVADVEKKIPFKDRFDIVISIDSWEFFPHPEAVLKNVYKALKENGLFIIITPNMFFAIPIIIAEKLKIKKLSPAYTYFNSFKYKVKRLANRNGFQLEKYGRLFHRMSVVYHLMLSKP